MGSLVCRIGLRYVCRLSCTVVLRRSIGCAVTCTIGSAITCSVGARSRVVWNCDIGRGSRLISRIAWLSLICTCPIRAIGWCSVVACGPISGRVCRPISPRHRVVGTSRVVVDCECTLWLGHICESYDLLDAAHIRIVASHAE